MNYRFAEPKCQRCMFYVGHWTRWTVYVTWKISFLVK